MTTRAEDGISRVTIRRLMFGLPRFGPWTSNLCMDTLTIIAAAIGETLRNTLDVTPKDMIIEIETEVLNIMTVRHKVIIQC